MTNNALVEVDQKIDRALAEVEAAQGRIGKVVALARATKAVEAAIAAAWPELKALADSPLGFLTDVGRGREKRPYTDRELQVAITHGILMGGYPFNGEICVITGRAYLGVSHFERVLRERADVADLALTFGVPVQHDRGALVACSAEWKQDGRARRIDCRKTDEIDARISVRVNEGMGVDAILGKARRKLLAKIVAAVTGRASDDGELPDEEMAAARTVDVCPTVTGGPVAEEQLPDPWADYVAAISAAPTIAEAGRVYDAAFGPESVTRWHPDEERAGADLFASRKAAIRGGGASDRREGGK